jgi:hypothetical protein
MAPAFLLELMTRQHTLNFYFYTPFIITTPFIINPFGGFLQLVLMHKIWPAIV